MMDRDLIDLLAAFRGAELVGDRCAGLLERLRRDEDFRRAFVDEIRMLGMLKAVQSNEPRWLALQEELGWDSGPGSAAWGSEDEIMRRVGAPARWPWPRRRARSHGVVAGVLLFFLVAFGRAVAGLALITGLLVLGVTAFGGLRWPEPSAEPIEHGLVLKPGRGLAVLTKVEAMKWDDSAGMIPPEGVMLPPGRFSIRAGKVVICFINGVVMTVQGPADLDLISSERLYCRRGQLRVRVPEGVQGFVVAGAGSAVVDLGAELAMNVEAGGRSRVMVFKGAAEASLVDPRGFPRRTLRFEQGRAYELDPAAERIEEAVARPDEYVGSPDLAIPCLELEAGYSRAVNDSRPVSYWRFESVEGGRVRNEVDAAPPLQVHGPIRLSVADCGNGCAVFPPGAPQQFLSTDGLWDITRKPSHAYELWVMTEGVTLSMLVGLYPPPEMLPPIHKDMHTELVELTAYQRHHADKPASARFLHRRLLEGRIDYNVYSNNVYSPRRWHHVVAQKVGDHMELFLDGIKEYSSVLEPIVKHAPCRLVVGRRTTDETDPPKDSRSFVGRIDELAIYDHTLSTEEIRHHYTLGRSAVAGP